MQPPAPTAAARAQGLLRSPALWASLCLGIGISCLPRGGTAEDGSAVASRDAPAITAIELTCDLQAGRWRVVVDTSAWAGGAVMRWTSDGDYVEEHANFRSIKAAPDGSSDRLRADISLVEDFRPAGESGLTAIPCAAEPSALIWVLDLQGQRTDCRQLGPDPGPLLRLPTSPICPAVWPPEAEDTGTGETADTWVALDTAVPGDTGDTDPSDTQGPDDTADTDPGAGPDTGHTGHTGDSDLPPDTGP